MWITTVNRKELLEVFEPRTSSPPVKAVEARQVPTSYSGAEYCLIWDSKPTKKKLPVVILLAPGQRRDFLAWASTYLATFRPFTAFCRVLERGEEECLSREESEPDLENFEEVCLGLILGEAATYLNGRFAVKQLSPLACARTQSFAMSRAMALGLLTPNSDPVSDRWRALREITGQVHLGLRSEMLKDAWSLLLWIAGRGGSLSSVTGGRVSKHIIDAAFDIFQYGEIASGNWNALTKNYPDLKSAPNQMRGPLENRVRAHERFLAVLETNSIKTPVNASFIAGYLTSQISPGNFDHAALLASRRQGFGSATLWYGFCAGLRRDSQLSRYGFGLGQRVLREVLRSESPLDRPRCDVAFSELEMMMTAEEKQTVDFRTYIQGQLEVEIVPGVTTFVRWPSRIEYESETANTRHREEINLVLDELNKEFSRMDDVRQKLARLLTWQEQSELPLDKKRKRR